MLIPKSSVKVDVFSLQRTWYIEPGVDVMRLPLQRKRQQMGELTLFKVTPPPKEAPIPRFRLIHICGFELGRVK